MTFLHLLSEVMLYMNVHVKTEDEPVLSDEH